MSRVFSASEQPVVRVCCDCSAPRLPDRVLFGLCLSHRVSEVKAANPQVVFGSIGRLTCVHVLFLQVQSWCLSVWRHVP